jgi:hypothetical protein
MCALFYVIAYLDVFFSLFECLFHIDCICCTVCLNCLFDSVNPAPFCKTDVLKFFVCNSLGTLLLKVTLKNKIHLLIRKVGNTLLFNCTDSNKE